MKLLGPFEAVSGMLMFGLTTAFIFAVIQRLIHARFDGEDNSFFEDAGPGMSASQ